MGWLILVVIALLVAYFIWRNNKERIATESDRIKQQATEVQQEVKKL